MCRVDTGAPFVRIGRPVGAVRLLGTTGPAETSISAGAARPIPFTTVH